MVRWKLRLHTPIAVFIVFSAFAVFSVNSEIFSGRYVRKGKPLRKAMSFEECKQFCDKVPQFCAGATLDSYNLKCYIHTARLECEGELLYRKDFTHYRRSGFACPSGSPVQERQTGVCVGHTYLAQEGHVIGGTRQPGQTTAKVCAQICTIDNTCFGFDWNPNSGSCWLHGTPHSDVQNSSCCLHGEKMCTTSTTTSTTTTTPMGSTTEPKLPNPSVTGDGGCPQPFKRFENSKLLNGGIQTGVTSPTQCKQVCFNRTDCISVDWNLDTMNCFLHTMYSPGDFFRGNITNVVHFRRTHCEPTTCYKYTATVDTPTLLSNLPALPLPLISCPNGLCSYISTRIVNASSSNVSSAPVFMAMRGCGQGPHLGKCSNVQTVTLTAHGTNVTYTSRVCTCRGNRCNSITSLAYDRCFGYFPLDATTEDVSGFERHLVAQNVSYDFADAKKNYSAYFNGQNSVMYSPTFNGIQHGYPINISDQVVTKYRPELTVMLYVKRSPTQTGNSTIIMHGPSGNNSFAITSMYLNSTHYTIMGLLAINKTSGGRQEFTLSGVAELDKWSLVALTVGDNQNTGNQVSSLDLYIVPCVGNATTITGPVATMNLTNSIAVGDQIWLSGHALSIGANLPTGGIGNWMNFFKGWVDDVWIFRGRLTEDIIASIGDQAKPYPVPPIT